MKAKLVVIDEKKTFVFSGKVEQDNTLNTDKPILPTELIQWYYKEGSSILTIANPDMNPVKVNATCDGHFECVHDLIIRMNPVTSKSTALSLGAFRSAVLDLSMLFDAEQLLVVICRFHLDEIPPTINVMSPIRIAMPFASSTPDNRTYELSIAISGPSIRLKQALISENGTRERNVTIDSSIAIPIPNSKDVFVEVS
jgi:hypothetical protein